MFQGLDLNSIWFVLVGVLFTGYAVLDGFDLGVGVLHLLTKNDMDRRRMLNAIGPVWDGNEVWLVTAGGALFAAFPEVYATAFSGFYVAFMLFLVGIIFRAVSIEFRSKKESKIWRQFWDVCFAFGSFIPGFLLGVIAGNLVSGIHMNDNFEYQGGVLGLLHPYSICAGLLVVSLFTMHGAMYIYMKTEGALQQQARGWVKKAAMVFVIFFLGFNVYTFFEVPHVEAIVGIRPHITIALIVSFLFVLGVFFTVKMGREYLGFIASSLTMVSLMILFGLTMYPNMIFSTPHIENSLTIFNAASTEKTLGIMFLIAIIGVPLVLAYTVCIYWIFRGKVQITDESY